MRICATAVSSPSLMLGLAFSVSADEPTKAAWLNNGAAGHLVFMTCFYHVNFT